MLKHFSVKFSGWGCRVKRVLSTYSTVSLNQYFIQKWVIHFLVKLFISDLSIR